MTTTTDDGRDGEMNTELLWIAIHEAGHAVVQFLEKDADPIHKVTMIQR